jgi:hypothetical protein
MLSDKTSAQQHTHMSLGSDTYTAGAAIQNGAATIIKSPPTLAAYQLTNCMRRAVSCTSAETQLYLQINL